MKTCECGNCDEKSDYVAIITQCYTLDIILQDDLLDLIFIREKSEQVIAINVNQLNRVCYFIDHTDNPHIFYVVDPVDNTEFY